MRKSGKLGPENYMLTSLITSQVKELNSPPNSGQNGIWTSILRILSPATWPLGIVSFAAIIRVVTQRFCPKRNVTILITAAK